MKKATILLLTIIIAIFSGCIVNDSTGLIRVTNSTHLPLRNVKIGDTFITFYVAPGGAVDYWYYTDIQGGLYTEGIPVEDGQKDCIFRLEPGYWVTIKADYGTAGDEEVRIDATQHGTEDLRGFNLH